MFTVGDVVSRKSYNNDLNFKIININGNVANLAARSYRLVADAELEDLEKENINVRDKEIKKQIVYENSAKKLIPKMSRNYVTGKILHIDGDVDYLKKCTDLYESVGVFCYGLHIKESQMMFHVEQLIKKYRPAIVVITGHDSYDNGDIRSLSSYKNSQNFANAVKAIRNMIALLNMLEKAREV